MLAERVLALEEGHNALVDRLAELEAALTRYRSIGSILGEPAAVPPVQSKIPEFNCALGLESGGREVTPEDWITINGVRTLIGQFCADVQEEYARRDTKIEELEGRLRMAELQAENERSLR